MFEPYVHLIAALAVLSRMADVWTTYMVSPKLKLEANPLVRRFRWGFALATILIGFIPYYLAPLGVIVFTASFMVAASNAAKIVMARALGEDETVLLVQRVMLRTPPWPGLLLLVTPGIFVAVIGGSLLMFYPSPAQWGYYFAQGMIVYALAVFIWYPVSYFRVRREAGSAHAVHQQSSAPE